MAIVKNVSTHVVSIRGTTIIPPLGSADIDLKTPGVPALLKRGVLEAVPDAPSDGEGEGGSGEGDGVPGTVAELKAALTELGIDFPEHAKKAELQALFDQAGK